MVKTMQKKTNLGHILGFLFMFYMNQSFSSSKMRNSFLQTDVEAAYVLNLFLPVICTKYELERAAIKEAQVSFTNLHNLKILCVDLSVILQEVLCE